MSRKFLAGVLGLVKQVEVDFGSLPVHQASFIIIDASVTLNSNITATVAYVAPTGKDLDELEMDALDIKCGTGSQQFTMLITGRDGYVHDKFKINYIAG